MLRGGGGPSRLRAARQRGRRGRRSGTETFSERAPGRRRRLLLPPPGQAARPAPPRIASPHAGSGREGARAVGRDALLPPVPRGSGTGEALGLYPREGLLPPAGGGAAPSDVAFGSHPGPASAVGVPHPWCVAWSPSPLWGVCVCALTRCDSPGLKQGTELAGAVSPPRLGGASPGFTGVGAPLEPEQDGEEKPGSLWSLLLQQPGISLGKEAAAIASHPGWRWLPTTGPERFVGRGTGCASQDVLLRLLSNLQTARLKCSKIVSQILKSHEIQEKKFEVLTFPLNFLSC